MSKEAFRSFSPQKLGPYESDFANFIAAFKPIDANFEQIEFVEKALLELGSYPNSREARLRYQAFLSVLLDLLRQQWIPEIRHGRLFLSPPIWASMSRGEYDNHERKNAMRRSLQWEREAQLKRESVQEFIRHMEQEHTFNGRSVSIRSLYADGKVLSQKLDDVVRITDRDKRESEILSVVQPYLVLINPRVRCPFTGFYLQDIWRYFRYTWSTPYNSTPGRNMFYLIRDAAQEYHPVIGIAALGSSMVQLTVRDDVIGWTSRGVEQRISSTDFGNTQALEFLQMLRNTLDSALKDLAVNDLVTTDELARPTSVVLDRLANVEKHSKERRIALLQKQQSGDQAESEFHEYQLHLDQPPDATANLKKASNKDDDLVQDALYRAKRAGVLRQLLQARLVMSNTPWKLESVDGLRAFWQTIEGQRTIMTLVRENKKRRVGINMMDIIVCGSVPPYNFLLGGKLVAMLLASPQIVRDYQEKYTSYASTIASRMKGNKVYRDSRLVFLGTTSLYASGSSQYNRVTIPTRDHPGDKVRYIRYGLTEGYGSVHFSSNTVNILSDLQDFVQGARLINNRFGEGVNPKLRRVRSGLAAIGLTYADDFLRHRSQRIVYGLPLGRSSYKFLRGETDNPEYFFEATSDAQCKETTKYICRFWAVRWLLSRIQTRDFLESVASFHPQGLLDSSSDLSKRQASQEVMKL